VPGTPMRHCRCLELSQGLRRVVFRRPRPISRAVRAGDWCRSRFESGAELPCPRPVNPPQWRINRFNRGVQSCSDQRLCDLVETLAQAAISSRQLDSTGVVVAAANLGATPPGWSLPTPIGSWPVVRREHPCLVSASVVGGLAQDVLRWTGCHDRAVCCVARHVAASSIRRAPIAGSAGRSLSFPAAEVVRCRLRLGCCRDRLSQWLALAAANGVWTSSRSLSRRPARRRAARLGGVVAMVLSSGSCRALAVPDSVREAGGVQHADRVGFGAPVDPDEKRSNDVEGQQFSLTWQRRDSTSGAVCRVVTNWRSTALLPVAGRQPRQGLGVAVSCWPPKGDRTRPSPGPRRAPTRSSNNLVGRMVP
jgi:hypothetical protein